MWSNILFVLVGFILGGIATAVVLNNAHRKNFARIISEVDSIVERTEELSTQTWKRVRNKITDLFS